MWAPLLFLATSPPAREPAGSPSDGDSHSAREPALDEPAASAPGGLFDADDQRDRASAGRAFLAEERRSDAGVESGTGARRRIEHDLERELRAHRRPLLRRRHAPGDRQGNPALAAGPMRETQLGAGEGLVGQCGGGPETQLRGLQLLGLQCQNR